MGQHTDILIFDVGLGQSVFIHPHSAPEYGMLIDCGHDGDFHPIDFLIKQKLIHNNILGNLTITNYDQDHFSGIENLRNKVGIWTTSFAHNLSSTEIKKLKEDVTTQLEHVCYLKDTYIHPVPAFTPPYTVQRFSLEKNDLENHDTNNLSQVVFVEHNGTTICISGDLELKGWTALIQKNSEVKGWLQKTNVFIASHHGRENGYCPDVFSHCAPECIIISDKGIVHDTQRDMTSLYGGHVNGQGVSINNRTRKVLTTRDDGHLWIQLHPSSIRIYRNFSHA
jgi:beta-lactamase superfamily II metal-dependent hydrolase